MVGVDCGLVFTVVLFYSVDFCGLVFGVWNVCGGFDLCVDFVVICFRLLCWVYVCCWCSRVLRGVGYVAV